MLGIDGMTMGGHISAVHVRNAVLVKLDQIYENNYVADFEHFPNMAILGY
jgi:hypothetical protein